MSRYWYTVSENDPYTHINVCSPSASLITAHTTYKTVMYKLTEGLTEAHFKFRVDWASPEIRVDWTSPEFRVDWTLPEFKVEFRVKRVSPEGRVDWASPELGLIRELIGLHLS